MVTEKFCSVLICTILKIAQDASGCRPNSGEGGGQKVGIRGSTDQNSGSGTIIYVLQVTFTSPDYAIRKKV